MAYGSLFPLLHPHWFFHILSACLGWFGSLFAQHPGQGLQTESSTAEKFTGPLCDVNVSSTLLVRVSENNQFSCQLQLRLVTYSHCTSSV